MQIEQGHPGQCESTSYVSSSIPSQNLIYYYTHFELFSQRTHSLAYNKYNQFLGKVARQLGEDWRYEANKLLGAQQEGGKSPSDTLFEISLSIWLEINRMMKHKSIDEDEENINYEMEYFDLFVSRLYQRLVQDWKQMEQKKEGLKQLSMGFFVTACSTWQDMVEESKSKNKGLFQQLSEKIQKQILFSPLMLAKEKILTFFNKKPKLDESAMAGFNPKNFTKFKQNLEEEELEYKMSTLKVDEEQLQESTEGTKRKKPNQEKTVVFQKIPQQNPINQNLLKRAYSYVLNSYQKQKIKWQVGKNFVTNIFQINYDKLINKIKGETPEENKNINVRVMKPAQDFYHTLMEVWLLFRSQSIVKFQDYLSKVKIAMGTTWSDKYINPTKLFFSRLYNEWTSMMKGKEVVVGQDEEIIDIFVERVKEQMKKNWDKEITEKTNDLSDSDCKET